MEEHETIPSLEQPRESYFLSPGDAGRSRLHLLHAVYGPSTEALLTAIGLHAGMRVVDIGCGIGSVTIWLAQHVGSTGQVVGVDMSAAQLEVARQEAATLGVTNVVWHEASAYAPGLPPATFDFVYCRFLLEHLTAPEAALRAMDALLKPGGLLVCEALDVASLTTDPP